MTALQKEHQRSFLYWVDGPGEESQQRSGSNGIGLLEANAETIPGHWLCVTTTLLLCSKHSIVSFLYLLCALALTRTVFSDEGCNTAAETSNCSTIFTLVLRILST